MEYLHPDPTPAPHHHNWSSFGTTVVEELLALPGVWTGRIRRPGQKRRLNDGFTIHQTLFIRTLHPLLAMPLITQARPAQIALLLNSYWAGIAKVLPEPFDATTNPQNYTIQKYHGVAVLHSVLPQVIQIIPAWGRSLADPIAYADVMHDLPTLGESLDGHHLALVPDATFWLSGPGRAAARFTGITGRDKLAAWIRALIPQPPEGLEI